MNPLTISLPGRQPEAHCTVDPLTSGGEVMDQDQVTGGAREFGGRVKDAVGGLTGDAKTQAEGKFDQVAGRVQRNYGAAVDAASDGIETLSEQVRQQPLVALLVAAAIGWVIGRVGRSM
jgi:uncharacterized protein YjbJ (UPF0337 family)